MLKTWNEHRALRAARSSADEQLLASRLPSPRLAWRVAELISPDHRVELGRALAGVVHTADERLLPNATPLNRGAVRACRAQLLELAAALFDGDRTVAPRGVLFVEALLRDGPLYGGDSSRRLRNELAHIRDALLP